MPIYCMCMLSITYWSHKILSLSKELRNPWEKHSKHIMFWSFVHLCSFADTYFRELHYAYITFLSLHVGASCHVFELLARICCRVCESSLTSLGGTSHTPNIRRQKCWKLVSSFNMLMFEAFEASAHWYCITMASEVCRVALTQTSSAQIVASSRVSSNPPWPPPPPTDMIWPQDTPRTF